MVEVVASDAAQANQNTFTVSAFENRTQNITLKPILRLGGKVVALDGKTPHAKLVVELVKPSLAVDKTDKSTIPAAPNHVLRLPTADSELGRGSTFVVEWPAS
jgi:hypothetical protein